MDQRDRQKDNYNFLYFLTSGRYPKRQVVGRNENITVHSLQMGDGNVKRQRHEIPCLKHGMSCSSIRVLIYTFTLFIYHRTNETLIESPGRNVQVTE